MSCMSFGSDLKNTIYIYIYVIYNVDIQIYLFVCIYIITHLIPQIALAI